MTPAEGIAAARAILGGEFDPMTGEWDRMDGRERCFWLAYSRLPLSLQGRRWPELSGDARTKLKNALFRAARRAQVLLPEPVTH